MIDVSPNLQLLVAKVKRRSNAVLADALLAVDAENVHLVLLLLFVLRARYEELALQ